MEVALQTKPQIKYRVLWQGIQKSCIIIAMFRMQNIEIRLSKEFVTINFSKTHGNINHKPRLLIKSLNF